MISQLVSPSVWRKTGGTQNTKSNAGMRTPTSDQIEVKLSSPLRIDRGEWPHKRGSRENE